jgi:prepilin-type N-terminal cleavage/methylation domain-containing protein
MRNRRHENPISGFTFLELILAIAIVSLLSAVVVPSLADFKRQRDLRTAAHITSTACDYARSLAVTTGRRARLVPERGRFSLTVEEDPLSDPGNFERRRWPVGITGRLPKNVIVEQVYYPVVRDDEVVEDSGESDDDQIVFQSEEEAAEERESVLLFEPDGSTRDTFIYLALGDPDDATKTISEETHEYVLTVAIVGVIGTSVIVPYYTEEIFEIYDLPEVETDQDE